jgi:hypothetical protein
VTLQSTRWCAPVKVRESSSTPRFRLLIREVVPRCLFVQGRRCRRTDLARLEAHSGETAIGMLLILWGRSVSRVNHVVGVEAGCPKLRLQVKDVAVAGNTTWFPRPGTSAPGLASGCPWLHKVGLVGWVNFI